MRNQLLSTVHTIFDNSSFPHKLDIICNTCIDSSFMYSPTSVIRNLDYPNAVPNVESAKKFNGIVTKIADSATEQSTCVCVSYVHVQCRHTVVRHRVQCEM